MYLNIKAMELSIMSVERHKRTFLRKGKHVVVLEPHQKSENNHRDEKSSVAAKRGRDTQILSIS